MLSVNSSIFEIFDAIKLDMGTARDNAMISSVEPDIRIEFPRYEELGLSRAEGTTM
jgi:hypothetical protein